MAYMEDRDILANLDFEITSTLRGRPALELGGYRYFINRTFNTTTYWICAENRDHRCSAKVTTKKDVDSGQICVIKLVEDHVHGPNGLWYTPDGKPPPVIKREKLSKEERASLLRKKKQIMEKAGTMPPKKRKASVSSVADPSREDSNMSMPSPIPPHKRKKRTHNFDPGMICQELYDTIRNHKDESGRLLCEAFIRVPKRRSEPEYYDLVSRPIDLLKIQHRLKNEEYDDIDALNEDVETLVKNAKLYYAPSSQEYNDACELWDLYEETRGVLLTGAFGQEGMPGHSQDSNDGPVQESVDESGDNMMAAYAEVKMETGGVKEEEGDDDDLDAAVVIPDSEANSEASNGNGIAGSCPPADENWQYEELFTAIVSAHDGTGRNISDVFKLMPSKSKYRDYYEVIKHPIDLKVIAIKIQQNTYNSLPEMFSDIMLMISNAKTFNEPGSQIYKDALAIKKIAISKKSELEQPKSKRGRPRKNMPAMKMTSMFANLEYESDSNSVNSPLTHTVQQQQQPSQPETPVVSLLDDDSTPAPSVSAAPQQVEEIMDGMDDDTGMGDDDSDTNNPLWVMYHAVKNYKDVQGQRLSEPFIRLPNRRIYPDYYEEIRRPMSFLKIQKKIKLGRYKNLDMLCNDMELMFENAKQYNIEDSKIYKDSCKLSEVMVAKKKEVLTGERDEILDSDYKKNKRVAESSEERRKPGRRPLAPEDLSKKRAQALYRFLMEYQVDTRSLIDIFLSLPSKKDYPDYYQVITDPIDMRMIEQNIKDGKYTTEQVAINDFLKMFNNAKIYNEESSQVFRDAIVLEKLLKSKIRNFGQSVVMTDPLSPKLGRSTPKRTLQYGSPLDQKLNELYNSIKDHADPRGRMLSTPFIKLPLKTEYPDYYEVIKKPVDMAAIHQRVVASKYQTLEDMVADFVTMFDNACKYNEPDSLIYKDALTLQRVCLEKKQELSADDDDNVPDVPALVQEMMVNLFISTHNCTDEEGRCYSDSFMEMPPAPKNDNTMETDQDKKPPTFQRVKWNLDRGRYVRVDRFQEDMFEVFEYARSVSRSDSQLYEDAVELQLYFIRKRDELCKKGEILVSPSLSYMDQHLMQIVEMEKKEKQIIESQQDEEAKAASSIEASAEEKAKVDDQDSEDSCVYKDQTFTVGDFVYIEPREDGGEPHIVAIEKLWKDEKDGEMWLRGDWFLRPSETYHVATKKFLEKEVFKSDYNDSVAFSKIMGKCFVMSVKEYYKLKPEGFNDKDVYVCESRYSGRHKMFKKIKIWPVARNETVKLHVRDAALIPTRVASVYAEDAATFDTSNMAPLDKEREIVLVENMNVSDLVSGFKYYEQFQAQWGWIKLGDSVYVKSNQPTPIGEEPKPQIYRIDKIWTDANGESYIHGPTYVQPAEVEHQPTRLFYVRELFKSSVEETIRTSAITGRCVVMPYKDFVACRITEVSEEHVYICEAKYNPADKSIKKFMKPVSMIRNNNLSIKVCDDEIYFFKKPVTPKKEPSPLLLRASQFNTADGGDSNLSASLDLDESSQMSGMTDFNDANDPIRDTATPTSTTRKRGPQGKGKRRMGGTTGYIVYAGEFRKTIQRENPEMGFAEISKLVGKLWRDLPKEEKLQYEERAKKIADEQQAKQEEADRAFNLSLQKFPPAAASPSQEKMQQHVHLNGNNGGTPQQYMNGGGQQQQQGAQGPHMGPPPPPPRSASPMFVAVPPRTQRLLHSEAYLKYIENLRPESTSVSNWEKQLTATHENTPIPSATNKLPVQWLGDGGAGHHQTTTAALWALRDVMMRDALNVSRNLEWSDL